MSVHKVRLPSVNDIFPTVQPQYCHQPMYVPLPVFYYPPQPTHHPRVYRVEKQKQNNAWTDKDDMLLRYLKEERNLGWREIAMHFKSRTSNGCQFRWRRIAALDKEKKKELELKTETNQYSIQNLLN